MSGAISGRPYEGFDSQLSMEPRCFRCSHRSVRSVIQRCKLCKCAHYCSRMCQKDDWEQHKKICKSIEQNRSRMKKEERKLKRNGNLFKTEVGDFYSLLETRPYCRARYALAQNISMLAREMDDGNLWEEVAHHHRELLRLCDHDNLNLRSDLPFVLLSLNRDQECYDFMKSWMVASDFDEAVPLLVGENVLEDITEFIPREEYMSESLFFVAALLIIKMRIVASLQTALSQLKAVQDILDPIIFDHVREFVGGDAGQLERQEKLVTVYLGWAECLNPSFLPAIVNPSPLLSQQNPYTYSKKSPAEAFLVINQCYNHFVRIPGAIARIECITGKNPPYVYKFDPTH